METSLNCARLRQDFRPWWQEHKRESEQRLRKSILTAALPEPAEREMYAQQWSVSVSPASINDAASSSRSGRDAFLLRKVTKHWLTMIRDPLLTVTTIIRTSSKERFSDKAARSAGDANFFAVCTMV